MKWHNKFLGKSIKVYLKDGGAFLLKVTGAGPAHLVGFDDEGLNIRVDLHDIDFIGGEPNGGLFKSVGENEQ